ncbi:MAG: antibiotic biosynthesis monooxygenase [Actinomycetota bacterium]|nr:antibiotic biosynthesis monooxygenase [Actinomycetota bacterium]
MAYAVIRHYKGSSDLIDELAKRSDDVEKLLRGIDGFQSYVLARSEEGGFSVSVYESREGADESITAAKKFVAEELSDIKASPPEVLQGEVTLHFNG